MLYIKKEMCELFCIIYSICSRLYHSRYPVIAGRAQMSLMAQAMFYLSVSVRHDRVTVSQHVQYQQNLIKYRELMPS